MTRNYVSIGTQQKREAVEIGTRYEIIHHPAEYGRDGKLRLPDFFPATRGVKFYGTLSEIEMDAIVFTDVEIPSQSCTGGSRTTYGIGSSCFVREERLDRVRGETIDISHIVISSRGA